MGSFTYGDDSTTYDLDDDTLGHLEVAVMTKLRRSEAFVLNLGPGTHDGSGTESLWMHPSIPVRFDIAARPHPLDMDRVSAMMASADTVRGLTVDATTGS